VKILRGPYDTLAVAPAAETWAVTLGTLDGVHRGHQAILRTLTQIAARPGFDGACAVTFGRHPRTLLDPASAPDRLSSDGEREALLRACGVDRLVVLDFDERLAGLAYDDFVHEVLRRRLGMGHFVLGHDVHFGRGRGGNLATVTALAAREDFRVDQVESIEHAGESISSTRIRRALADGEMDEVLAMLGHPYPVWGTVERGRQLGRTLGFPTANLVPEHPRKLLPPRGVYAGWARTVDESWMEAVVNIGTAPTVTDRGPLRIEAHVLDRDLDLYDRRMEVAVARRLRSERRYEGLEALRDAIVGDVARARQALAATPDFARPERLDDLRPDAADRSPRDSTGSSGA
jgi:riboflavin kinase/FMN adenylyltransferase